LAQSHEVFEEARRQGISTTFLYNNLIDACARCKALEEALEVFKSVRPGPASPPLCVRRRCRRRLRCLRFNSVQLPAALASHAPTPAKR
jgi:pentatricopeptide repeat protein